LPLVALTPSHKLVIVLESEDGYLEPASRLERSRALAGAERLALELAVVARKQYEAGP